jgi:hypothetical protein
MIDRTTKLILAAIAAGLWANVLTVVLRAVPAHAQQDLDVSNIQHDLHGIYAGNCLNPKICASQ